MIRTLLRYFQYASPRWDEARHHAKLAQSFGLALAESIRSEFASPEDAHTKQALVSAAGDDHASFLRSVNASLTSALQSACILVACKCASRDRGREHLEAIVYFATAERSLQNKAEIRKAASRLNKWLVECSSRVDKSVADMEGIFGGWILSEIGLDTQSLRNSPLKLLVGHRICASCAEWAANLQRSDNFGTMPDSLQKSAAMHPPEDQVAALLSLAEKGDASAQFRIAGMYHRGSGVSKDTFRAKHWFLTAADAGHLGAQAALGTLFMVGDNTTPRDIPIAVEWFKKAALRGDSMAQFTLGLIYHSGEGIERNVADAYAWLHACRSNGGEGATQAAELLRRLEKQLSVSEKVEFNIRAQQLLEQIVEVQGTKNFSAKRRAREGAP